MEVAIPGSNNSGTPFQREVREWQRLDPNTGALLTGRLEADRWINGSLNSYGKVVDSQNVSQPNGTQHSHRKQLEVIQSRTSSGSMQVIRAHTVQTTSSRWTATSSSSASSSNSSSPALMTSLSAIGTGSASGYFPTTSRLHANLDLTNDPPSSGIAEYDSNNSRIGPTGITETNDNHLLSNLHINQHAKLQPHLLSTAPSLKLSNLMKSTQGSQNNVILHKTINNSNSSNIKNNSPTANRSQRSQHQLFSSASASSSSLTSRQLQNNKTTATTTATTLLQQQQTKPSTASAAASTSSMSSTSTITPTISARQITTSSSGSFCYDSSRYDLPTIMTDTYVGGSSGGSGRIIDICSRDLDDDDVGNDNNDDRLHSSSTFSPSSPLSSSSSSLFSNKRQSQRETIWQPSSPVTLQRGRSISTDDLSTKNVNPDSIGGDGSVGSGIRENNVDGDEDYDEPAEWRRVSKIRRSFQFPSTSTAETLRSRPADLPASSVSVSKIREELENGRRLSTAMRNNHLDLVALDNILNGGSGTSSPSLTSRKKTASFLTAESLKEIRGKLKKLSDESLYKDDFVTKLEAEREDSPEKVAPNTLSDAAFQYKPRSNGSVHTTNSLESRSVKYKDTSSAEWHLRRKSYGFEKMSPPDDKSMFRFENSTDSGLGRSSDLGNWSPTTDPATNSTSARGTVITFGEQQNSKSRPLVQRRLRNRTQPQSEAESAEMKRHSIAVDESHYVRENLRKTSAVHLNGFYSKDSSPLNSGFSDDNSRRQKRVEFCKTEVHFAAESGRVNIVETDGKPPPSNNFRRRRRSSSSSSNSSSSNSGGPTTGSTINTTLTNSILDSRKTDLPKIHFGDERKTSLESTANSEIDEDVSDEKTNVTVSIPITLERNIDSAESRDGDEHQDEISIRGILKNKPPKPKPYHLGENIESSDALWGVQLKPVAPVSRGFSGERDQTEEDFKEATVPSKSVAERVRIVEERKEGTGYSTKINLNLSNSPYEWTDKSEIPQSNKMSIELHSPLTPTIKKPELIRMQAPVAKPRTSTAVKQSTQNHQTLTKTASHVAPQQQQIAISEKEANENLKIVKEARGARKLREHELSYFGIKMQSNDTTDTRSFKSKHSTTNIITTIPNTSTSSSSSKRSLPSRRLPSAAKSIEEKSSSSSSNKWSSLPSDKPDLLRHSPILVEPQVITKTAIVAPSIGKQQQQQRNKSPIYSSDDDQTDGIYENIKQPYCRQKDLERDQMILDEMTKTADQIMKAVSDEAVQKDLRRQSISRRSSKPLETIDEKISKSKSCKTATRTKTTTAHRLVRECSNRPSSASSGDSLPTTPIAQRSRSRSRDNIDYANVKSKLISRPIKHRSSSGESRRSVTSSTEDITHQHPRINNKMVKRSSTKDNESLLVRLHRPSQSQHRSIRSSTESHDRQKVTPRSSTRDRVESHDHQHQHQHQHSSRSHRSSQTATKSDVEHHKRTPHSKSNSNSNTVESKSSTKTNRSRTTSENDQKPSKSSTERVSRSKGHLSRTLGNKSTTISSSGGNNSDTLIHNKNASRSTHSSSLKATAKRRSSKDRK